MEFNVSARASATRPREPRARKTARDATPRIDYEDLAPEFLRRAADGQCAAQIMREMRINGRPMSDKVLGRLRKIHGIKLRDGRGWVK
jgi:hypothetical protein